MAAITGILCQVITSDLDGAGTDGRVYLGVGGREFRLDSEKDDYERGSWREYALGELPPTTTPPQLIDVVDPTFNDPRIGMPLDTNSLTKSPVYLRFEPSGDSPDWNLAFAAALLYDGGFVAAFTVPVAFDNLWLGDRMGKIVYLTEHIRRDGGKVLERGQVIAERMTATGG
ncbi:hypothetical protein AVL62_13160 [Serinicoccus chungangensis]|uniref:Uncharacterized protein n=1 Tax=Serinicoccus chungangensis TaxID=767452 RepID=A0A0W8IBQ9_9MICO|nr:hypothetical protein [Serinicoccus chungangensis]KUG57379.1 hypothetical protein AVL62_13160 [Serinicoccus chungangensis]